MNSGQFGNYERQYCRKRIDSGKHSNIETYGVRSFLCLNHPWTELSFFHVCHNEWKAQTEAQHYLYIYTSCKLPVRCGFHSAFVDHSAEETLEHRSELESYSEEDLWDPEHVEARPWRFRLRQGGPPYFSSIGPKDFQRIFSMKNTIHFHRGSYIYGNLQPLGDLLLMWKNIWFSIRKT